MQRYTMEELIPVVAMLTEKYTSKESSSVTYETARQLMGAVQFCIQELEESKEGLQTVTQMSAMEAYELGYQKVCARAKKVNQKYNQLMDFFDSYGNENYEATVKAGISGFLNHYDARFMPMDTVITMDYPVLLGTGNKQGVDAVDVYVDQILLEQSFLASMPREYVRKVLHSYQANYAKHFYNIAAVVLRFVLAGAIRHKENKQMEEADLERFKRYAIHKGKKGLEADFTCILKQLVKQYFPEQQQLFSYLKSAIPDLCTELENGLAYGHLKTVFHIE